MKTVYVLGSLNTDLVISTDKIPEEGETVSGSNFRTGCGGKGLNQAVAAAKLGSEVKFLGAIGEDSFGEQMLNLLKANKVDVKNVKKLPNVSSGIAMIVLYNGNNRIVLDLAANLLISKSDIDSFLLGAKKGDIFVTQLENNLDAIEYGLKSAKEKGMITVLNPAPADVKISKFLECVDYLIPNETEYELLKQTIPNSTRLIITLGEKGYKYIFNSVTFSGEAPKVNVIDTTGAGDCFVGAFVSMLAKEKAVNKETLDTVTKIASLSTTRPGSSVSSPSLDEVKNIL